MALIPAIFVQSNNAFDSFFGAAIHTQSLAFVSNVTQGDLLYAYVYGDLPTISAGNPTNNGLQLNSLADTRGSTWNQLVLDSAQFDNGLVGPSQNADAYFFGVFYAFAASSGPCTVQATWGGSGAFTKTIRLNIAEWKNVGPFIALGHGFQTSSPATVPSASGTFQNELFIAATGFDLQGPSFVGAWGGGPWVSRISSGSPGTGPVWDTLTGPTGLNPTTSLKAPNTSFANYWASMALFQSAPPTAVTNGNGFFEDYPQMTWMKNVAFLCRDYWDVGLSSPYVGQEWPIPNSGGAQSGQTYPY
jgi:hypothetical protein